MAMTEPIAMDVDIVLSDGIPYRLGIRLPPPVVGVVVAFVALEKRIQFLVVHEVAREVVVFDI